MRLRGRLALAILCATASVAAFGAVAWRVDGVAGTRRYPAPLDARGRGEIDAVLDAYRRIYQDLYASGGEPAMLNQFPATAPVKHRIYRDIGFLRDAGLVHVQDLASATLLEATADGPGVASAVVLEEWNAELQRSGDRSPASRLRGVGQAFRYTLVRVRGEWVIAAWDLADVAGSKAGSERAQ